MVVRSCSAPKEKGTKFDGCSLQMVSNSVASRSELVILSTITVTITVTLT